MDIISRHSQGPESVQFGGHRIDSLLFVDGVVLLASSYPDLQFALGRFSAECEVAWMRISTFKSDTVVLNKKRVNCPICVCEGLLLGLVVIVSPGLIHHK